MRKDQLRYLLILGAGCLIGLLSLANISHAQTIIDDGYIYTDSTWEPVGNPYIIQDTVYVPPGTSLYIEKGVNIIASSSLEGASVFRIEGNIHFRGDISNKIKVSGIGDISLSSGRLDAKFTDFNLSSGIYSYDSEINIASSSVSGANNGLDIKSSRVNISGSSIFGNTNGLYIRDHIDEPVYQVNSKDIYYDVGGIGNALFAQINIVPSSVKIERSSIVDNSETAIKNEDISYVNAINNWWGREQGPSMFGVNKITGNVHYQPWLSDDPFLEMSSCCSNVLFIPGLQGSRLYLERSFIPDNRLWEPNRNADVQKLYMNQSGSSTHDVYSGDPIGKAYGLKDIYGNFISYLEELEKKKKINQWIAFGYDWRLPITEVVAGKIKNGLSTSTQTLSDLVSDLATRSRTGKVSLIAHSNGGLVAKYLIKVLEDQGKAELIDKVISVAVPYIGTPQAIIGLLHGYGQSIVQGIFLNEGTARGLGQNMPSAYSLLPSRAYFSKVFTPTITFASSTVGGVNDGSYPIEIRSYDKQSDFIVDSAKTRITPNLNQVENPLKGNRTLLFASDIIHGLLDFYTWPGTISKWAIAGWNKKTAERLVYSDGECKKKNCSGAPSLEIGESIAGDGTVVFPSAIYESGELVSMDLDRLSDQENRDIAHANILGASSTIATVDKILNTPDSDQKQSILDEISKIPGVTIGVPDFSKKPITLDLSTHSPVDLHVYDSAGRHTGLVDIPDELVGEVDEDLLIFYDTDIPGSSYRRIRQSDGTYANYISLPDEDSEKYNVVINGNDFGAFSYVVERKREDQVLDTVRYENIPTTPFTVASTTVFARKDQNSPLPQLDANKSAITVDIDGNGSVDIVATTSLELPNMKSLNVIKDILKGMSGNGQNKIKNLIKKMEKIEDSFKRGKLTTKNKRISNLRKYVEHINPKKMTAEQKLKVIDLIDDYISQFE